MTTRPNLKKNIDDELNTAAKETGMKKTAIIVAAFTLWNRKRKQEMLADSYRFHNPSNRRPATRE